ncbi:hypothetical protein EDC24_0340 [Aquisalibacillus elongatus]|uniref:Uncharacterized protein n=1 Tax=Aquisalibacillus elongatus TaxID=485577 RepID=A0A3N5BDA7_9BACI|nr:hypothetical protein EDC24_0340 [Aquisalibacillus elongatus]
MRLRDFLTSSTNYLAWFQVLESNQHQLNEVTVNDMILKGNLIPIVET